ncbi:MAG: hypothetical protein GXO92_02615 [FCB group bacterium]|nr:hypothetical protein [FCB group bacterium]
MMKYLNYLIPVLWSLNGCVESTNDLNLDYRQSMRIFIQNISYYAKAGNPDFIIIPQNGQELLTENGDTTAPLVSFYVYAIDGQGREDLFYGYDGDNTPTPLSEREDMLKLLDLAENNGVEVLAIDYCSTPSKMDDSYSQNANRGYISFAADHRELDNIPDYPSAPYMENNLDVANLSEARNFLYLINPVAYNSKTSFLEAIQATNYDLIIIDLFYDEDMLTPEDVLSLKTKKNGGKRLVIAYMSIGEAEDYRYYWQADWSTAPPSWLGEENPDWPGNYKVHYWNSQWQALIYGDSTAYLDRIIAAGFDGVYLDIVDAFEYFEY